jgi:hypothetical protein
VVCRGSSIEAIRYEILVRVRSYGVPVRAMTIGMMPTLVPCQLERSALARGVYFCKMRRQVS